MLTRSTYKPQCILAGFAALIFGVLLASSALGQTPFNGISIQEVEISAASQIIIDAELDAGNGGPASARCWRIYICMDDPDWELQAIWGDANAPWHLGTATACRDGTTMGSNPDVQDPRDGEADARRRLLQHLPHPGGPAHRRVRGQRGHLQAGYCAVPGELRRHVPAGHRGRSYPAGQYSS